MRKNAWPLIAKVDPESSVPEPTKEMMEEFEAFHEYIRRTVPYDIIMCPQVLHDNFNDLMSYHRMCHDFDEIFIYKSQVKERLEHYLDQLKRLGIQLMLKIPCFNYYQGYLDICGVFLTIFDPKGSFHIMNSISRSHLINFLIHKKWEIKVLRPKFLLIIDEEEPQLRKFFEAAEFHLDPAWFSCWFVGLVQEFVIITRLFDLFIASDPLMPTYLSAAIILSKHQDILNLKCSKTELADFFEYKIWEREKEIPFENLIKKARLLMLKYPPENLPRYEEPDLLELEQFRWERSTLGRASGFISRNSPLIKFLLIAFAFIILTYLCKHLFFD